ncbi:MAG: hypothetical protein BGO55_15050 [Sphingobacteriales bacterium 50-39]|nr:hypothetical protein [Sphingobacteriales bacterium]OJW54694.1 MAG: hypothetical protein BGO55_15050 [Sphingobacteriales bacterium 50-39]
MARQQLLDAQDVSIQFFRAIEENKLIVPGKTEAQLNEDISDLALKEFGIRRHPCGMKRVTNGIGYWSCNL